MKRLPAPPNELRWLLAELPTDFVITLHDAVGTIDSSGAAPSPFLVRADVRRRTDGYFVWLRFETPDAAPRAHSAMAPWLLPLLALPRHESPPKELLNPIDRATGTTLGKR